MNDKLSCFNITSISSQGDNRMKKLHNSLNMTPECRRILKLIVYTKDLCKQIGDLESPHILNNILDTTIYIMGKLYDSDIIKRGKAKDGLIIVCINYACKQFSKSLNYNDISKSLNLHMKHITAGEKIILELMNTNRITLDKSIFLSNKTAIEWITEKQFSIIPFQIIDKGVELINLCKKNNIILEATPLIFGVSCLYYVIIKYSYDIIDIKLLSKIFNVSVTSINNTYHKLKNYNL